MKSFWGLLKFNDSIEGESERELETERRLEVEEKGEEEKKERAFLLPSSHLLISEELFPYSQ